MCVCVYVCVCIPCGVNGCALIFSCKNSNIVTNHWTTIHKGMLDPVKKDTPHLRAKEKPSKTVGGAKLHLESNLIPTREAQRAQTKPCAHQDPGPTRDWARPAFEGLSVSCRGMGEQWPVAGTAALAAADLRGTACDRSLLGVGHH